MTTLVTGAAGFVGSHLIELLEQDSAQIIAFLRPGTEPLVSGTRVIWHGVELHDRESVAAALKAFEPTEIYHLAGVRMSTRRSPETCSARITCSAPCAACN